MSAHARVCVRDRERACTCAAASVCRTSSIDCAAVLSPATVSDTAADREENSSRVTPLATSAVSAASRLSVLSLSSLCAVSVLRAAFSSSAASAFVESERVREAERASVFSLTTLCSSLSHCLRSSKISLRSSARERSSLAPLSVSPWQAPASLRPH